MIYLKTITDRKMKREIRFRGRDKDGNWVFGNLIHRVAKEHDSFYILPCVRNLARTPNCHPLGGVQVEADTIGQYTGLKDDNEREIFEGDILVNKDDPFLKVIEYDPYEARFTAISNEEYSYPVERKVKFQFGISQEWIESGKKRIVGNIYDNPELLTLKEQDQ